jgi:hypothetical protein
MPESERQGALTNKQRAFSLEVVRDSREKQNPPLSQAECRSPNSVIGGRRSKEMIRKLKSGKYRLYSRKKDPKTGKRRNLGTFDTKEAAKKHERAVQYFKRH